MSFYALRYYPDVPFAARKHDPTVGRWDDFADADDARERRDPGGRLLEVVVRGDS